MSCVAQASIVTKFRTLSRWHPILTADLISNSQEKASRAAPHPPKSLALWQGLRTGLEFVTVTSQHNCISSDLGGNFHEFPIIHQHEYEIQGIIWEMSCRPLGNLKDRKTSSSLNQKVSQQERTSTWFPFCHINSHLAQSNEHDISWRTHDDKVLFITGAEKLMADSWQQRRIPEMFSQFKLWFRVLSGLWISQKNVF